MTQIALLRHGQASFGSDNYDQLSQTGHQQAQWLGEYLKGLSKSFDRIVIGTMVRHLETANGVLAGLNTSIALEKHAGLNEYNFQGLLDPLKSQYPDQWLNTNNTQRDYYHNMKQAITYWMDGRIKNDGQDTWKDFCTRIRSGFAFAYQCEAKRILVVSSGGPIAVILADVLKLDQQRTRDLTLQIKNSSISTLLYNRSNFTLDSFNDISHLNTPSKVKRITFA